VSSKEFVASYIDAWNQHDPGGVAEHLARNGVYLDIPEQQKLARDELITYLNEFFTQDNSHYSLVGEVLTGENTIAFQYRACPIGLEKENVGWMGAEFITMDGEVANRIEDYYRSPDLGTASPSGGVQRYAKSGLDGQGLRQLMEQLNVLMKEQRVYLDSELSLPQLAEQLGCSVNHLSQAINAGFGMSFFDFINRLRVQDAIELLCVKQSEVPAILNVALAVGFNSTSTFYAAFKKSTGQTPAQYRKARASESE
jgi:AraC-like DNA-binding protein